MGVWQRIRARLAGARERAGDVIARIVPLWQAGKALPGPTDWMRFAEEGYQRNVIIHTCIREKATSTAEPDLVVDLQSVDGTLSPAAPNDPLTELLLRPGGANGQSQYEFLEQLVTDLETFGNAYIHKVRAADPSSTVVEGRVVELELLRPHLTAIVPGSDGRVQAYKYGPNIESAEALEPGDVIHFRLPDPLDQWYGLSPIMVAALWADLDTEAAKYLRAFFANAGSVKHYLKLKARTPKAERQRVKEAWREQYSTESGWHTLAVLDADAELHEVGSKPKELELGAVFGESEARMCGVFGVPPIIVAAHIGLLRSTFANYAEARRSLWEETLIPMYTRIADKLNSGLAPEFADGTVTRVIRFDLSKVEALQEDRNNDRVIAISAWEVGITKRNEARRMLNGLLDVDLPDIDGPAGEQVRADPRILYIPTSSLDELPSSDPDGSSSAATLRLPAGLGPPTSNGGGVPEGPPILRDTIAEAFRHLEETGTVYGWVKFAPGEAGAADWGEPAMAEALALFDGDEPDDPILREAHALAARAQAGIARSFVRATEALKAHTRRERMPFLVEALKSRNPGAVFDSFRLSVFDETLESELGPLVDKWLEDAAHLADRELDQAGLTHLATELSIDRVLWEEFQGSRRGQVTSVRGKYMRTLQKQLGATQTRALKAFIDAAFAGNADAAAVALVETLGLTKQDSAQLAKFADKLERDGVPARARAARVNRQRKARLRRRAVRIGQHEALRVANMGQLISYRDAVARGAVKAKEAFKRWLTAGDDRVDIEICEPLDGTVVPLNEAFTAGGNSVDSAPAHVGCRCGVSLEIRRARRQVAERQDPDEFEIITVERTGVAFVDWGDVADSRLTAWELELGQAIGGWEELEEVAA